MFLDEYNVVCLRHRPVSQSAVCMPEVRAGLAADLAMDAAAAAGGLVRIPTINLFPRFVMTSIMEG